MGVAASKRQVRSQLRTKGNQPSGEERRGEIAPHSLTHPPVTLPSISPSHPVVSLFPTLSSLPQHALLCPIPMSLMIPTTHSRWPMASIHVRSVLLLARGSGFPSLSVLTSVCLSVCPSSFILQTHLSSRIRPLPPLASLPRRQTSLRPASEWTEIPYDPHGTSSSYAGCLPMYLSRYSGRYPSRLSSHLPSMAIWCVCMCVSVGKQASRRRRRLSDPGFLDKHSSTPIPTHTHTYTHTIHIRLTPTPRPLGS
ncbi:hypothetical protein LY76DRAFT_65522 [Colletotrichum caudatum]|nr:hypothetical protein LY76DRAFT_65522 [Colletotrichum caudatum]